MLDYNPIRQKLRNLLLDSIVGDFSDFSPTKWYLFVSRVHPWSSSDAPVGTDPRQSAGYSDLFPPPNPDTINSESEAWRNMIGAKRVSDTEIAYVIPRIDWTVNTVYTAYRDDLQLINPDGTSQSFYVLVNGNRVYKCISNDPDVKGVGSKSLYAPTTTEPTIQIMPDGYRWKFMYIIPDDYLKFLTKDWMPVFYIPDTSIIVASDTRSKQAKVQDNAINGAIDHYLLIERGSAYSLDQIVVDKKDGSNLVAGYTPKTTDGTYDTVTLNASISSSKVNAYDGMTIYFPSGYPGGGQQRIIRHYDNVTHQCTLLTPLTVAITPNETRFLIGPTGYVVGDGTGADVNVQCNSDGYISDLNPLNVGSGYTYANVVVFPAPVGSDPVEPDVRAVISPKNGHGANAVSELNARNVMICSKFSTSDNFAALGTNEFRTFGFIRAPKYPPNGVAGTENETLRLVEVQSLSSDAANLLDGNTFQHDQIIVGTSSRSSGVVYRWSVSADGLTGKLLLRNPFGTFIGGETTGETLIYMPSNWLTLGVGESNTITPANVKAKVYQESNVIVDITDADAKTLTVEQIVGSYLPKDFYDTTHTLTVTNASTDAITAAMFPIDSLIQGNTSQVYGRIVSCVPATDGSNATLRLVGVEVVNAAVTDFAVGESVRISSDGFGSFTHPEVTIASSTKGDLIPLSGDITYITNVKPVSHSATDKEEEFKVVLGL
jgi:hypothetical protein